MASLPNAYLPIDWFPEYQTFSYQFDYVTVIVILSFICFVPSVFATVQMILFYLKTSTRNGSKEIHPYVFKSFLCMQFCNIIATALDYIVNRISYTTLVTSYIATMKSEIIIRYLVAALYAFIYMSQLYTVLFCFIRVLVLFNPRTHSEVRRLQTIGDAVFSSIVTFCIITTALLMIIKMKTLKLVDQNSKLKAKAETTLKITMCIILLPSMMTQVFARLQSIGDVVFSSIVTFCIVTMTLVMIFEMKTLKSVDQNSKLKAKAETTLKITMCIILIPSMTTEILIITCFWASTYASYMILARPILVDCRVNIVSCYFYWTHPCFKQQAVLKHVNVMALSTN
ncbi:hypothetical protein GCK72_020212 [Caenorhabditis remanei]|uniref:Uncharacterized protein n=1 Tax=Caenorhabditis remanei TaxID=31234 RepID=A0A6A5GG80_CAERE|nr:hypothetical protein GCK72_020212 [Caenorhabditis remanei]KAF1753655.1 hypothetical protein GCK72_020212 [Caenorhabditis remanei]